MLQVLAGAALAGLFGLLGVLYSQAGEQTRWLREQRRVGYGDVLGSISRVRSETIFQESLKRSARLHASDSEAIETALVAFGRPTVEALHIMNRLRDDALADVSRARLLCSADSRKALDAWWSLVSDRTRVLDDDGRVADEEFKRLREDFMSAAQTDLVPSGSLWRVLGRASSFASVEASSETEAKA